MTRYISLLLLLVLAGCGTAFQQPQVTLQNVQLAGLGLRGGTLMVDLQVVNPNRFALTANELDYQVAIADAEAGDTTWVDLASGTWSEGFTVGARATEQVQIPIEFSYSGLGGAAASVLRAGTFNYLATGTIDVRTPIGTREVSSR
jgi:LEA14-like dessication related protein